VRLALAIVLAACGPDPCSGEPSIELGGADDDGGGYVAFEDGADRNLVYGTQGGFHVWLQLRTRGLCPGSTTLERRAVDTAGAVRVYNRGPLPLVEVGDAYELPNAERIILCPPTDALPVIDQPLRFEVTATDGEGDTAYAEIHIVPRCPAGDDRCPELCTP
jgi:hypothetical protein